MHNLIRKLSRSAFPAFMIVWTLSCTCLADQKSAQPDALQPASRKVTFIAEVENSQDFSAINFYKEKLMYNNGRFRTLRMFTQPKSYKPPKGYKPVLIYHFYDGRFAHIVWSLNYTDHSAAPSPASCSYTLSCLVERDGVSAVMKRFHLPASAQREVRGRPTTLPFPHAVITMLSALPSDANQIGAGSVAGRSCNIYTENMRYGVGKNAAMSVIKYWVDRHTGLVLRKETTDTPPPDSPMPRTHSLFAVLWLHQVRSLPLSLFELPPGTKVMIPETFGKVKLPPGVKRAACPARFAACGIAF